MSAAPLRHFYAAPEHPRADGDADTRVCQRAGCARPASDPVHLTPGDDAAWTEAVKASTAGHNSRAADPAVHDRAAKRHAARWTFGTAITSDRARGPSAGG
jgi:hypothetical protein